MNLKDCVEYLRDNGYIIQLNSLPIFTNKFYHDFKGLDIGLVVVDRADVVVKEGMVKPKKTIIGRGGTILDAAKVDWVKLLQDFIVEAGVPGLVRTDKGSYNPRHATKAGRDGLKAALLEGTSYDVLLGRAKAYYKTTQMPVKVENYFEKEYWRNDISEDGDRSDTAGIRFV